MPKNRDSIDNSQIVNVLTVDVEDYFQVSAFEPSIDRQKWDHYQCRVERNTHRVLELLGRRGIRATFFVLGWIAERYPALVNEIHACGHEIASHGYGHHLIYNQSPEEFRDDLRRSRDILSDIIGCDVTAYRAPSFSITRKSLWALDILAQEGFLIDTSIFPVVHDRYGIPGAPKSLHRVRTASGTMWEFPPSVSKIAGVHVPCSGGGYFRLFPFSLTLRCLRRINRHDGAPFVFYFHPWEIDPEQPRIKGSAMARFRHYVNLASTENKLERLFDRFRFTRISDAVQSQYLRHGRAIPVVDYASPSSTASEGAPHVA